MKSLLTMSETELAAIEAGDSFGVMPAIGVSASASVFAWGGMFLRYSPGDSVPVAGMDHWAGQLTIAAGLGITMLIAAAMIKGVFMKRLQWAVLISLLLHMCICLTLSSLVVDGPLMAMETGDSDVPIREFSLPDYGGAESQDSPSHEWERPTEVDLPESEQHELDRRQTEPELQAEPEQFESERQLQNARVPGRREMEQELERERQLEIEKQMQTAESDAPEQLEAPELQTQQSEQPQLQAREMDRAESQLRQQRQQYEVESQNDPRVSSARIANRSEVTPQEIMQLERMRQRREQAEARMSDTSAERVEIAEASNSPSFSAQSRQMEQARQSQSNLPQRTQFNDSLPSSPSSQMQIRESAAYRSSSSQSMASSSSPTSGGAASLQRSTTSSGRNTSAASTSAHSVSVSSARGTSAPQISANTAASSISRGPASVPNGQSGGGDGIPSMRLGRTGVSALQSGSIGRTQGNSSGPQLGSAVASSASGRFSGSRGAGSSAAAVGVRAGDVAVTGASGSGGSSEQVLASGPSSAASSMGRGNIGGLPASDGQQGTTGFRPTGSGRSGLEQTMASNARGREGLSGRSSGPSARLSGSPGSPTGARTGTSRRSAGVALPSGALQAEATGSLVITGPQAQGGGRSSSATLSGPRTGSVSRRSSGLPGLGRGPSSAASSRRRSTVSGLAASGLSARRSGSAGSRPKISSRTEVASMFKRAVQGISPIPTERLSATFSMRTPEGRAEAVSKLGGSDASEAAVARGLEWLASHQFAAGNWSIHDSNCKDHDCGGHGNYEADTAATGLALLSFLGAGHTHRSGEYQKTVQRGLAFLMERQGPDGDLFRAETEFCWLYSHGMASIALCEAYGMTKDPRLKQPAQQAINFILAAQHPKFGGWRYRPKFESDTSVSGWQLMALKSAEIAGLNVPKSAYDGVGTWLNSVEKVDAPGRFSYHPTKPMTPSMSAEGLLMRQYLGAGRTDDRLLAGASFLKQRLPREDVRDVYYWYYATQVMFHMQGDHWDSWNGALRDMLVASQDKGGPERGSWDPAGPTKDTWGQSGGRHYVTCLNLLMLEVYYRHLPLYLELKQ